MKRTNSQSGLDAWTPTHRRGEYEYSVRELNPLSLQAKLFEPFTRQLLQEAGLSPAWACWMLDVDAGILRF